MVMIRDAHFPVRTGLTNKVIMKTKLLNMINLLLTINKTNNIK